jgi:hypothetical protein
VVWQQFLLVRLDLDQWVQHFCLVLVRHLAYQFLDQNPVVWQQFLLVRLDLDQWVQQRQVLVQPVQVQWVCHQSCL